VLRTLLLVTLALTVFYSMTAIVFSGCEPSYQLVFKPWPMWGWGFGGAESDCYWQSSHPGVPEPWWLNAPRLVYASMEDSGGGNLQTAYFVGWFATALLWMTWLVAVAAKQVRRVLQNRPPNFKGA
jgi:hypothetical protein